jgi:large subunit ribosomal protein L25
MSDFHKLSADIRDDVGKGASRRLRREGRIPAVIYGGEKDPLSLTLEHREVWHAASNEAFFSSILEITVADGRSQQVVIRDLQRHPFKSAIMHVDFMRVSDKEELRISVPLHFVGEEASPAGREAGVVIQHQLTDVEVAALPKDLPEYLEVDLSALEPGSAIMLADITLPAGVTIPALTDDEETNLMVANAIHISESQGTGAAAAAEEEAAELEAAGETVEGDEGEEGESAEDEGGEAPEDKE